MTPSDGKIREDSVDTGTTVITFKVKTAVLVACFLALVSGGVSGGLGHLFNNAFGIGATEAKAAESTSKDTSAIKEDVGEMKNAISTIIGEIEDTNEKLDDQAKAFGEFKGYMQAHLENLERRIVKEVDAERSQLRADLQAQIDKLKLQMDQGSKKED